MFSLNMCRICEKQTDLIDLSMHTNYIEQYLIVGNVSFDNNDGLPQFICRFCITQLLHFCKFKQKCEDTYQKLQDLLLKQTNQEIKTEQINDTNFYQNDSFCVIDKSEYMETETMIDDFNLQATSEPEYYDDDNIADNVTNNFDNDNNSMNSGNIMKKHNKSNEVIPRTDSSSSTKIKQFICDICETESKIFFESLEKLELHMSTFHGMTTNLRQCDRCGKNSKWYTFDKLQKHHFKSHKIPFKCNNCGKCFLKKCLLTYHMRKYTGQKPYKCDYCKKCFSHKTIIDQHMSMHSGNKPFKCQYCEKSFSRNQILIAHIRAHTGEKPYKCQYCEKGFVKKKSLISHNMKTHTNEKLEKTHKCQYCKKCYYLKDDLVRHSKTHTCKKPFKCEYCEKSYSSKSDLITHTRMHTGDKPYKCVHCKKCFSQSSNLNKHIGMHTGEKPFKCEYCEKCFPNKFDLIQHTRTHTGEKPYKCEYCEKCFAQKSNLNKHNIRIHTGEKRFKCEYCEKCFITKLGLIRHTRTHNWWNININANTV